jgi:diguanylate cyclase (GGDEF)-like protein
MVKKNDKNNAAIMLIGDHEGVFVNDLVSLKEDMTTCPDMFGAIEILGRKDFKAIFVIMSSVFSQPVQALQAIRNIAQDTPVYLIARMYEEPEAIELSKKKYKSQNLVEDYYICPIDERIITQHLGHKVEKAATGVETDWRDQKIKELEKLATTDDLTGLKNRRYIKEFLRQVLQRAGAEKLNVTVLLFDIDNFKHYNDSFGHSVGDNVLKQVATMMTRCCRKHDVIGRIGGDEFAVVFWDRPVGKIATSSKSKKERRQKNLSHPKEPMFIAQRFRDELCSAELSFLGPQGKGVLTISGGLSSFPDDGLTV